VSDKARISKTKLALVARWEQAIKIYYPHVRAEMVAEYRFHHKRLWRFDFAFPSQMIGIELQGGTWVNGGHNRGAQMSKDYEKINTAQATGWKVFQFTTDMLRDNPQKCVNTVFGIDQTF
jgi:very-short-patch-repair endonuclease